MNAWRCTECGKLANAKAKPRTHIRNGEPCGPFAEAVVAGEGAALVDVRPIPRPTTYRRSLIQSFETCGRRTLHEMKVAGDLSVGNVGASADMGSAMHAVLAELLRRLRKTGREQPPLDRALEVMRGVLAAGPWVLPPDERDTLSELVEAFALYHRWDARRILAIEETLSLDVLCPDGEIRTLTGTPDLILAAPGPVPGIIIPDHKSGFPRKDPRRAPEPGQPIEGLEYMSYSGHYALDLYGLLALHPDTKPNGYPSAQFAEVQEIYYRVGGPLRVAVLRRDELADKMAEVGLQMMLIDRAIIEGDRSELWRPRPGRHCLKQCPVSRSCPVPEEQRGLGALGSPEEQDEEAGRFVVVDALRQAQRDALKASFEETGRPPEVGDGTGLFWRVKSNGKGREFGVFPLEDFRPVRAAEREAVAA